MGSTVGSSFGSLVGSLVIGSSGVVGVSVGLSDSFPPVVVGSLVGVSV